MTVGKVKEFSFPKHNSVPMGSTKTHYKHHDVPLISGGEPTHGEPETSGGKTTSERISGGEKFAKGGPFKHPLKKGALHKTLGIPEGKKIPAKTLAKAEHSSNPLTAKRARLAETMKSWHHKAEGGRATARDTYSRGGPTARKTYKGGGLSHPAGCSCSMCGGGSMRR